MIDDSLVSINIDHQSFQLWQNQSAGIIELRSNKQFDAKSIVFFNVEGTKVDAELIGKSESGLQYDVSGISSGIYFVRLHIDGRVIV